MRSLSDAALERLRAVTAGAERGARAARYELREEIGRGGMGAVWRAWDRELEREVAVKVLTEPAPHGLAERLQAEARVLGRLEHPGIVPVHDAGILADGRVFYAMKLVRGRTLEEHAGSTASLAERLRLFLRICEAVAFAHARGVVHRDLKPANVMIGAFGEVLVLDWGVAKTSGAPAAPSAGPQPPGRQPDATLPGAVLGTRGYAAPEQVAGRTGAVDSRTDVHALGAVMRFLVTLRPPLEGDATHGAGYGRAAAPRALAAIWRKATEPDPTRRYASAAELGKDVARWLEGLPVGAHSETPLERARRLAARHRVALWLVVGYLAMRVALLAFGGS